MSVSFPLTLPSSVSFTEMTYIPRTVVGFSASRFTGQQQTYVWPGQWWEVRCKVPPLHTDLLADEWVAFLLKLNGREGTFNMGPSTRKTPSGGLTLAQVGSGAVANSTTLPITLFSASYGLSVGDWLQYGSGSAAKLHRVTQVNEFTGSTGTVEVFPRLRSAYTSGAGLTLTNPVGHFRLSSDDSMNWTVDTAKHVGLQINAMEVL